MSKTLELDDISKDELLALKEEINHRLKDASFWETIEVLSAIDVKAIRFSDKREKIALSCIELKKLQALGFLLLSFLAHLRTELDLSIIIFHRLAINTTALL